MNGLSSSGGARFDIPGSGAVPDGDLDGDGKSDAVQHGPSPSKVPCWHGFPCTTSFCPSCNLLRCVPGCTRPTLAAGTCAAMTEIGCFCFLCPCLARQGSGKKSKRGAARFSHKKSKKKAFERQEAPGECSAEADKAGSDPEDEDLADGDLGNSSQEDPDKKVDEEVPGEPTTSDEAFNKNTDDAKGLRRQLRAQRTLSPQVRLKGRRGRDCADRA